MGGWELAGVIAGILAALGTCIAAAPAVWRFMCLPGRIEQRLEKLDQLDSIEQAAYRAAELAEDAHAEWKGATKVVTHEMARVAASVDRHDRKLDELDGRVRKIEQRRP